MVKFKFLEQFPVDHLAHPIIIIIINNKNNNNNNNNNR